MSIVELPWQLPPLTKNRVRRMHFQTEAKLRAQALQEARWAIKSARLAPIPTAVVILHWRVANNRRQDGDGADPTKAICLDALVAEGVLIDDSWRFVAHSGVTCHPPIPGLPGAMWLSISDPSEDAA